MTKQLGEGDNYTISNSLALFHKAMIKLYKISKQIYEVKIHLNVAISRRENSRTTKKADLVNFK